MVSRYFDTKAMEDAKWTGMFTDADELAGLVAMAGRPRLAAGLVSVALEKSDENPLG